MGQGRAVSQPTDISTSNAIAVHPPKLMRAVRRIMSGSESVQERLDDFTRVLVDTLRVEVASIYLLRPGRDLELSSTVGLNPDAVHLTRMAPGEGLVGHVALTAKPLNLADAASHPLFSYRPETGEEEMKSFLGVPILRRGGRSACWSCRAGRAARSPRRRSRTC